MEEGSSLFEHRLVHDLSKNLDSSEAITSISGSASEVFIGTSIGRIFHFGLNSKDRGQEMRPIQTIRLPIKTPISSLDYASALGLLMAIANSTLYEIQLETKEIVNHKTDITAISINSSPTNDNPFCLQFAMATTGKKILIVEKNNYENEIIQRLSCSGPIYALAYNRNSICYASGNEYYVYDILRKSTIPLFPFDVNVLRKPLIAVVDQGEYLLSGMDGLCIFVSPSGASHRPPFHIPSPPIRSFFLSQQYIYVCTDGKIHLISVSTLKIDQVIEINGLRLIANLDGLIFGGSNGEIYIVDPISWESQVDTLIENGNMEAALKTAEDRIQRDYSDQGLLKLNDLRQKIGFQHFFNGHLKEAMELFKESELDPYELVQLVPELVYDFRATHFHQNQSIDQVKEASKTRIITFIKDYLTSRNSSNELESKLSKTALLEFDLLEGKIGKITNFDSFDLSQLEKFLDFHQMHNHRAHVLFQMKNDERAFKIWQDLQEGRANDPSFNLEVIVLHLQRTENPKAFLKVLEWLTKVSPTRIKEVLNRYRCICEASDIIKALESNRELLIWYLEGIRRNRDYSWDTTLASYYVDTILDSDSPDPDTSKKLREILLQSKTLDRGELGEKLGDSKRLEVERILVDAKMNPEHAVVNLISRKELEVAEMVCTEYGHENPKLGTMLLKEFLANPRDDFLPGSIGRLLNRMAGYANPEEIVRQLPAGTTLNEISGFLARSLSHVESKRVTADMAAILSKLKLEQPIPPNKQKPILIDEDSTCPVCKKSISLADKLRVLATGYVVHADCQPYPYLCPVTNQIFPELMFDS